MKTIYQRQDQRLPDFPLPAILFGAVDFPGRMPYDGG
jgi:hypothetical protein